MQDFKRFIISSITVVIIVVIVDLSFGRILQGVRDGVLSRYPFSNTLKVDYLVNKNESDILIIGPSTASHHYNARALSDSLNMTVFNGGIDGTYIVFETSLIHLILDRYSPKVIIWELYEDALSNNLSEKSEYQYVSLLYPYYDKNNYCKALIDKHQIINKIKLNSTLYRYNSRLSDYIYPFLRNNEFDLGYVPIEPVNTYQPVFLSSKADDNIAEWKVELFKETLDYCKSKGVILIFSSSPRYLDGDIKTTMQYRKYREIVEQYGYAFIDSYNDEPFASTPALFKDNNHMNSNGVTIFMEQFIPKLKRILFD